MLDMERIPRHVAVIMDGNGRWAKKRGLPRTAGHRAGMYAMKEIVKRSQTLGVEYLTVYAFSTENWKRSDDEVGAIFKLLVSFVESELAEICENNVRINILGDWSALPTEARKAVERALESTKDNTGLKFNIALNYGGRDDIVRACRALAAEGVAEIDEAALASRLYTAGMPDPELLIRTGGEERISNFLLWQVAYSEFVFTPVYWPDFTPEEYEKAIEEYQSRDRRFGGVKA